MAAEQPAATDRELLEQLLEQQQAHRDEVAAQREEIAQLRADVSAKRPASGPVEALSAEELEAQRMAEVGDHSHYCPACGLLGDYPQKCVGKDEAPHYPTEMVETTELTEGDKDHHTAAPFVTGEGKIAYPK